MSGFVDAFRAAVARTFETREYHIPHPDTLLPVRLADFVPHDFSWFDFDDEGNRAMFNSRMHAAGMRSHKEKDLSIPHPDTLRILPLEPMMRSSRGD